MNNGSKMFIAILLVEKKSFYDTNRAYRISLRRHRSVIGAYAGQYIGHVSKR